MRFIHTYLYPLLAASMAIIAATCWLLAPEPEPPRSAPARAEAWSLPQLPEHDSKKSIESIAARNIWGVVDEKAAKAPEWNVLGIVRSGADRFVLLAYEGKPVETLKVGDALPDGSVIARIETDRFFVRTVDHKEIAFGMYKNAPAK